MSHQLVEEAIANIASASTSLAKLSIDPRNEIDFVQWSLINRTVNRLSMQASNLERKK